MPPIAQLLKIPNSQLESALDKNKHFLSLHDCTSPISRIMGVMFSYMISKQEPGDFHPNLLSMGEDRNYYPPTVSVPRGRLEVHLLCGRCMRGVYEKALGGRLLRVRFREWPSFVGCEGYFWALESRSGLPVGQMLNLKGVVSPSGAVPEDGHQPPGPKSLFSSDRHYCI